jgi:hypothetical protein
VRELALQVPPRHEFKYLITEAQARAVRGALAPYCTLDRHSQTAPEHQYVIETLYLDTPRRGLYWASRAEQPGRMKVRVRTYGDRDLVFLEVKRKQGDVVRKSRARVPFAGWAGRLTGPLPDDASPLERDFRAQVDRHLLEPATLVHYRREAWVGEFDDYARVTFDREVRFQKARALSFTADASAWLPLDDVFATRQVPRAVVLELKCGLQAPRWMKRLTEQLGLFRLSYSKYCTSIERSEGRNDPLRLAPTTPTWR